MPFPSDNPSERSLLDALKHDDYEFFGRFFKGKTEAVKKVIFYHAVNFNAVNVLQCCFLSGIGSHSFSLKERYDLSRAIQDFNSTLAPEIRSTLLKEGFVSRRSRLSNLNEDEIQALECDKLEFFEKNDVDLTDLFHLAIHFGAKKIFEVCLKIFLENQVDVKCLDPKYRSTLYSALHNALDMRKSEIILQMVFDNLSFFKISDTFLTDLFHLSIHFGEMRIFQLCLKNAVDAKYLDPKYRSTLYSALHNALDTRKSEIILQMVFDNLSFFKISDTFLTDLFHLSIHFGEMCIFQLCLKNGVDCTQLGYKKNTALYHALNTKDFDLALKIFNILIESGCDPKEKMSLIYNESTVLHQAALKGSNHIVKFLLDNGLVA